MRIEDLTAENAPDVSVTDLVNLRYRIIQLHDSRFKDNETLVAKFMKNGKIISAIERSALLTKYKIVTRELRRRGESQATTQPIDREIFKKSMNAFDPGDLPHISVVKGFAAVSGEFLANPKTAEILNLNFKCSDDQLTEPIVTEIISEIHKATEKDIACGFSQADPEGEFMPVYDLVLVPRLAPRKETTKASDRTVPFEKSEKAPMMEKWNIAAAIAGMTPEELNRAAAWIDERAPFEKMKYKLIHHRKDGRVVYKALARAMAGLTDDRKGGRIPEDDRRSIYDHLTRHYRQFEKEPPPFKTGKTEKRTMLKPYPSEHACRLKEPEQYDNFARTERTTDGKKYSVIFGIKTVDGKKVSEEQSYRYPKTGWTETEARAHCKSHDGLKFEPAVEKADFRFKIMKIDQEKQMVGGVVYAPEEIDTQDEYTDAAEIEKAQEAFMQKYAEDARRIKIQHQGNFYHFPIIESFIPEKTTQKGEDTIPAGAWWLMVKVTDRFIWDEIKAGRLTGFSMGGMSARA